MIRKSIKNHKKNHQKIIKQLLENHQKIIGSGSSGSGSWSGSTGSVPFGSSSRFSVRFGPIMLLLEIRHRSMPEISAFTRPPRNLRYLTSWRFQIFLQSYHYDPIRKHFQGSRMNWVQNLFEVETIWRIFGCLVYHKWGTNPDFNLPILFFTNYLFDSEFGIDVVNYCSLFVHYQQINLN